MPQIDQDCGKRPDQPRFRHALRTNVQRPETSPFLPVAEDIEWFRDDWFKAKSPPSNAALRRGSAALRHLLCEGTIAKAWKHHGLAGTPTVKGPDLRALAAHHNHELRHAVSVVAGGACVDDVQFSLVGAWRINHPKTGVPADADEGFAVSVGSISRHTLGESEQNDLAPLVEREWRIGAYVGAYGAVRRGQPITRQAIIEFFANYAGGVHLDRVAKKSNAQKSALYELVEELDHAVTVDKVKGVYFELLSIGQAIGTSESLQKLADAIRKNGQSDPEGVER